MHNLELVQHSRNLADVKTLDGGKNMPEKSSVCPDTTRKVRIHMLQHVDELSLHHS
jgi:hypothetical protein